MSTYSGKGLTPVAASKVILSHALRYKQGARSLLNMMSTGTSNLVRSDEQRAQSNSGAAIVMVNHLTKGMGDEVELNIQHMPTGTPTMGSRKIAGRLHQLETDKTTIRIDRMRWGVEYAGKDSITAQRVPTPIKQHAQQALRTYFPRLMTEHVLYQAAGMRGDYYDADDMILPLEGMIGPDGETLDDYLVNPLKPPTFNRHFYAGNAKSIGGTDPLTTGDEFDVDTIHKISRRLEEMSNPPQAVNLSTVDMEDPGEPFYVLWVTPGMWQSFVKRSANWATLASNASARAKGFNHWLFRSDCMMQDNILIKKYHMPIRANENSIVKVSADDDAATVGNSTVPAGVTMERGILMGANGIGVALGRASAGKGLKNFSIEHDTFDFNEYEGLVLGWTGGVEKLRFPTKSGRQEDLGICVVDAHVPVAA